MRLSLGTAGSMATSRSVDKVIVFHHTGNYTDAPLRPQSAVTMFPSPSVRDPSKTLLLGDIVEKAGA